MDGRLWVTIYNIVELLLDQMVRSTAEDTQFWAIWALCSFAISQLRIDILVRCSHVRGTAEDYSLVETDP